MKKIVFGLALCAAAVAQADYLLWTVLQSDIDDAQISEDVDKVRVGYVQKNGSDQPAWAGTALAVYDYGGNSMGTTALDYNEGSGEDAYKIDMTGLNNANYGFYIELLNEEGNVIGRTGKEATFTYATYASLSEYIATGDISSVPTVSVWHGGGFEAVPEPSSMALLALGAGLVGLRRKLKKGKKDKKAKKEKLA